MAYRGHVFIVIVTIIILLLVNLSMFPFRAAALSFHYDFAVSGVLEKANLLYLNDSFADGDSISLTNMTTRSAGRVAYAQPVRLWDCRTSNVASFSTSFFFEIGGNHNSTRWDGLTFFIGPFPPTLPQNSSNEYLGLYTNTSILGSPPAVAVEFDTFWNSALDPPGVTDHVGIDINSLHSINYTTDVPNLGLSGRMSANITYDAGSKIMAASVQLADGSIHHIQTSVDLIAAGLPQDAGVGFSASTGAFVESHQLLSWSFNSTDMADVPLTDPPCKTRLLRICMIVQAILLALLLIAALLYYICMRRRIKCRRWLGIFLQENENPDETELSRQELLEKTNNNLPNDNTMGPISLPVPREFTDQELSAATEEFLSNRKLGEGAFGEVYRGDLPGQLAVAVKRLTLQLPLQLQSEQIRRNYVTEIMTLGQLHHRNLVKLIGWCDAGEHLLLVYELMANRSVDRYLHNNPERLLTWPERYKIVLGVGYAIEYLHTGCPTLILHRDIKPSNVMLNNDLEPKLGDFGLVRQMEPGQSYLTGTTMMGSNDYIDPVCIRNNNASTASDVYSFGVLLLEIATEKDPATMREVSLIDAVRDSYTRDTILQEADRRLDGIFEEWQMKHVLVVGLSCVASRREHRPSIREVVYSLSNSRHPLPVVHV